MVHVKKMMMWMVMSKMMRKIVERRVDISAKRKEWEEAEEKG
jgi:hypothetical protein